MKKIVFFAVAAALAAGAAQAGSKFKPRGGDYWKQLQVEEEFRRAREVGGYNDPVTALGNIRAGQATSKDISTGVTNMFDLPQFGTVRLKGRWND